MLQKWKTEVPRTPDTFNSQAEEKLQENNDTNRTGFTRSLLDEQPLPRANPNFDIEICNNIL